MVEGEEAVGKDNRLVVIERGLEKAYEERFERESLWTRLLFTEEESRVEEGSLWRK